MSRDSLFAPRRGEEAAKAARRDRRASFECESLEERLLLFNPAGDEMQSLYGDSPWELLDQCCELVGAELASDGHEDDHLDHVLPPPDELIALSSDESDWATDGAIDAAAGSFTIDTTAPLSETFSLNSNLGASHTIYLDFDGHITTGTHWNTSYNGGQDIVTPAYDTDGNTASFSDAELQNIQFIWQRVAEDFMPFDVNVTTADPGYDALTKSGSGDSDWGIRVVVGGSSYDWYGANAGGVARVGSFNYSTDTPTFVFEDQMANGNEKYTAEAISHEVGHTLGLSHDGASGTSYYQGHGGGETGWAPLMGVGYYQNLTQWSKGEYSGATQTQDDLAIITGNNGFGYRVDDHGDSSGAASSLVFSGSSVSGNGIIEQSSDVDFFSFSTDGGSIDLSIDPFVRGPNLDILAELYDAANNLIFSSNPMNLLGAVITTTVPAGQYFLSITGVGQGDPSTGYSDYASLGQYSISGTIAPTSGEFLSVSATDAVKSEGDSGSTGFSFQVSRSGDVSGATTVDYSVAGSSGDAAIAADFFGGVLPSGTVSFAAGEVSKTILVNVAGDAMVEADESFVVLLSNASGSAQLATAQAVGTILNDDAPPPTDVYLAISATDANKAEGDSGLTPFTFTVSRSGAIDLSTSVDFSVVGSGGSAASAADFAAGEASTGSLAFAAGETSKSITVYVAGDTDFEPDETFAVRLSNASGGAQITIAEATGVILNDDAAPVSPGITVSPTSGLTTKENGSTASFSVVLDSQPTDTVVIDVVSLDLTEGRTSTNQLIFTVDNWSSAQTVVVTGVDDADRDGNVDYSVRLTTNSATLGTYASIDPDDVVITNQDDEKGKPGGGGGGGSGGGGGKGNGKGNTKAAAAAFMDESTESVGGFYLTANVWNAAPNGGTRSFASSAALGPTTSSPVFAVPSFGVGLKFEVDADHDAESGASNVHLGKYAQSGAKAAVDQLSNHLDSDATLDWTLLQDDELESSNPYLDDLEFEPDDGEEADAKATTFGRALGKLFAKGGK